MYVCLRSVEASRSGTRYDYRSRCNVVRSVFVVLVASRLSFVFDNLIRALDALSNFP